MIVADDFHNSRFHKLINYLSQVPAVSTTRSPGRGFGSGEDEQTTNWWVKFALDINHPLAWSTVQELGYVLNGLSLRERLPTTFKPVSPPPYLNGGPADFLGWVIEGSTIAPDAVADWLETRLPRPVEDLGRWSDPGAR